MQNYIHKLDKQSLSSAIELLSSQLLVAMPTETVYGLAADAYSDIAVTRIYELKQRPAFNPLISHVSSIDMAQELAEFTTETVMLVEQFWPGPLTIILPRRSNSKLSHLATAGLDTVAIRMPDHPIALQLIERFGQPLVAPSANPSQAISPTTAEAVQTGFADKSPFILDGGNCIVGLESTIVDLSSDIPTILRPGGISIEQLQSIIGQVSTTITTDVIKAPGMTKRHYAPGKPLRLNAVKANLDEVLIGFGSDFPAQNNLSIHGDLAQAAANLFSTLRALDTESDCSKIAVAPIPDHGLGMAINDRLQRAAA